MTDTAAREEAVERVRAYVESWEGFEPSVTISDERDPNSLYLGDLRLLLSGGEGGSVAIASREGRAVIANLATEELLALVLDGDHRRGCQGREYTCSCGYDTRVEREATTLRSALTDPRQPSEAVLLASVSPGELADWAQAAFEGALPDDATPYDVGKAFGSVGEHLHAVLAERLAEMAAEGTDAHLHQPTGAEPVAAATPKAEPEQKDQS